MSFGGDGIATTPVGTTGGFGYASAVAIQADDKIVLAGPTSDAVVLVRFEPNGTIDPPSAGMGRS